MRLVTFGPTPPLQVEYVHETAWSTAIDGGMSRNICIMADQERIEKEGRKEGRRGRRRNGEEEQARSWR